MFCGNAANPMKTVLKIAGLSPPFGTKPYRFFLSKLNTFQFNVHLVTAAAASSNLPRRLDHN
jgi:hypothetical protein